MFFWWICYISHEKSEGQRLKFCKFLAVLLYRWRIPKRVLVWLLSVVIVYLMVIMRRHLWRQYPSIKGNKIYSDFTFATAVLLILSLHYEGQIAFIKLFIMKLLESPSVRGEVTDNESRFIYSTHGCCLWMAVAVLHMFLSNSIHSYTDISCCNRDVIWDEWKLGLSFSQAFCYVFCYSCPETTCEPDAIPRHWFLLRPFHCPAIPSCALPCTYDWNCILY